MRRRVQDAAPGVRDVRHDADELQRIHELDRRLAAALDAERHHAARRVAVELLLDELVVLRAGEPGEVDPRDLLLGLEPLGDLERALRVATYPEVQRLEAEVQEECVERRGDRAEVAHQVRGALHDVGHLAERLHIAEAVVRGVGLDEAGELVGVLRPVEVAGVDDAAADLAGVAVHVLRRRVGDDVAAELERTAEDRRRESVVDDKRHAVLVRDLRELRDVEYAARGVRDRLAEDALSVRAEGLLYLRGRRIRVDEREFDAELLEGDGEEVERAAVDLGGRDDMVAGIAEIEDGERRGRLAGARENSRDAAFEGRDLLRDRVVRRVREASVEISWRLEVEEVGHVLRRVVLERRR